MSQRAVFFDRDDTLMRNIPYLGDPTQVHIFPEAPLILKKLREAGFLLFVVSNQSGVGRGLITREQVVSVEEEMLRQLGQPFFTKIYNSYAAPDDPYATDRKPSPELVLKAAQEHALDLPRSFFVGDRLSDIECGENAGCRTILLRHSLASRQEEDITAEKKAEFTVANLEEAAQIILDS